MRDILFYDGTCGLCHWAVRVAATHDRAGVFAFAPLTGATAASLIPVDVRRTLPDSLIVRTQEGALVTKSDAVLYVMSRLDGWWRACAVALRGVPRPLRDGVYDAVARLRYPVLGRTGDACPVVPASERARFLD